MEDTLGDVEIFPNLFSVTVLILVLMEDTLGVYAKITCKIPLRSLNPCSNGRYSRRDVKSCGKVMNL